MTIEVRNFNHYQELALRTVKPDDFITSVSHCVMGMVGEIGEFREIPYEDRDKRIGELGDCMWYSAVLANVLGFQLQYIVDKIQENPYPFHGSDQAVIHAARLTDIVKKTVFYGEPLPEEKVLGELVEYFTGLLGICTSMSVNPMYVGLTNIKKLAKRYKDGRFDAGHAINRDYQAESDAAGIQIV